MNAGLAGHIAAYHIERGDPAAARAVLDEASEERSTLADAYAAVAQAYVRRRDLAAASDALACARDLGDTAGVIEATAQVAGLAGDAAAARASWRRLTAADPSHVGAWMALARADEAAGDPASAIAALVAAADLDPPHASMLSIAARLRRCGGEVPHLGEPLRLAFAGSSTLDQLRDYAEVACWRRGFQPVSYVAPFGQYAQVMLDAASPLYEFAANVIVLAVHGRALFPALYADPLALSVAERRAAIESAAGEMTHLLERVTEQTTASVIVHTFATPRHSPFGLLDLRDDLGQSETFAALNGSLAEAVRARFPTVHLLDEDRLLGGAGKQHATDPRLWFVARIGYAEQALRALAREYARIATALRRAPRKCLVLDLDNTLWGGSIGDDGIAGIALGHDAPGNAYRALQEVVVGLYERGVILAVASKNDEATALRALAEHPDMLLRPHHFAAMRINWDAKPESVRSIAEELNIGVDSIVFVDDNPAECAQMRAALPQVHTVELPRDPALYRRTLLELTDFDALSLTEEDRARGRLYAQRRERESFIARSDGDLGDYLAELRIEADIGPPDEAEVARVAQLINKTNQFNMTARRLSEPEVRAAIQSPEAFVLRLRLRDRFGDHGLVGAAIAELRGDTCEIGTFVMSCRVLGCGAEVALLHAVAEAARARGSRALCGIVVRTDRNEPFAAFFGDCGFVPDSGAAADGSERWLAALPAQMPIPSWYARRAATAGSPRAVVVPSGGEAT